MKNIDDSLEPLAGTVVYSGVLGTTPNKRIPIISEAFPPNGGHLAYTALGHDRQGRSTSVIMDCEHARTWAESAEAELRWNPLKRLFRPKPQSAADIDMDSVVRQMSPWQRLFPPAHLGKDVLAETIIIGMLDASREDQTPRLDAQVVSYNRYKSLHSFKMPKERSGGPEREIPDRAYAKPNEDVLIACGNAWDVGFAAELLPQQPLSDHVRDLTNALPFLGDKHEDMPNLVKRFPHTVAHNAAQSLVRGSHKEIGYKEAALRVNYQTLRDVDSYTWIISNGSLSSKKTGASLTEALTALDELRPHLRRVGIFDAETMEQHAAVVSKAVETVLASSHNTRSEVLARCAKSVARSVLAPSTPEPINADQIAQQARQRALDKRNAHVIPLDQVGNLIQEFVSGYSEINEEARQSDSYLAMAPHRRALEDVEFLRASGVTEVSVIVEKSDALGDELAWKVLETAESLRAQEKSKLQATLTAPILPSSTLEQQPRSTGRER